jgi:hypothetical protein
MTLPMTPVRYPASRNSSTKVTLSFDSGKPFMRRPWHDGIRLVISVARFGMQMGLAT